MRADIQHEVSHDAKKLSFLSRFQHIRRWPPTSAGKSRCLPVVVVCVVVVGVVVVAVVVTVVLCNGHCNCGCS